MSSTHNTIPEVKDYLSLFFLKKHQTKSGKVIKDPDNNYRPIIKDEGWGVCKQMICDECGKSSGDLYYLGDIDGSQVCSECYFDVYGLQPE